MAGSNSTVKVSFIGDVTSLARASKQADAELSKVGKATSGVAAKSKVMAVAGIAAVSAFAKTSTDKFAEVGRETVKLQRYIGGTVEDASRLRFAAQETGVGVDDLSVGLGKFSKALVGAGDKTKTVTTHVEVATGAWRKQTTIVKDAAGHFQTIEKMVPVTKMQALTRVVGLANPLVAKLGFAIRDAHGKLLPMSVLLPKVAEKFKTMPNGAEKTALALQLFGKSGMTLMPFLNKGADGIKELEKESDKFGNTLNSKDTAAIKANIIAKRQWHAAITGIQIQLGRALIPIMTTATKTLQSLSQFVRQNSDVIKPLVAALAILAITTYAVNKAMAAGKAVQAAYLAVKSLFITATDAETGAQSRGVIALVAQKVAAVASAIATKAMAAAQWVLNAAMDANPIGLVVVALAALAAGFVYAFKHVKWFHDAVMAVFNWIKGHWPLLLAIMTGPIGVAVLLIVKNWKLIGSAFQAVWTGVLKPTFKFLVDAFLGVASTIVHGAASAFGWIPGIGGGLKNAAKKFDAFRDSVNKSLDGIKDKQVKVNVALAGGGNGLVIQARGGKQLVDAADSSSRVAGKTPALAEGGIVRARPGGMLATIGEGRHDEAVIPLDGRQGGGGDINLYVTGTLDDAMVRKLETMLARVQRTRGTKLAFL